MESPVMLRRYASPTMMIGRWRMFARTKTWNCSRQSNGSAATAPPPGDWRLESAKFTNNCHSRSHSYSHTMPNTDRQTDKHMHTQTSTDMDDWLCCTADARPRWREWKISATLCPTPTHRQGHRERQRDIKLPHHSWPTAVTFHSLLSRQCLSRCL